MPKRFLLFILVILSACEGCEKADPKPLTELEKLPPATQEGKYTFGCLVNGKAYVTKNSLDVVAIYQLGTLQIAGETDFPFQSISIVLIENSEPIQLAEYPLTNPPYGTVNFFREINDEIFCEYPVTETISGKIIITKFDKTNYIVSGLFEFETQNNDCESIVVTDGRFDIKYIP